MEKNLKETEVIEGTKLIADFMEVDYEDVFGLDSGGCTTPLLYLMDYYTSWNSLMPVVEKIEHIKDEYHGHFGVYIGSNNCTIQATKFRSGTSIPKRPYYFCEWTLDNKIMSTWFAVTYFLKWYNKEQSVNRSVATDD